MRPDRLLFLGAIAFACGCNNQPPAAGTAAVTTPPTIKVVKPEKRSIKRIIEQPGTVHAFEETVLYPKFPGFVRALNADPDKTERPAHDRLIDIGSRVKKDQVLAELAVPELEEEFKQKEALIRQNAAEVVQAQKAQAASVAGVTAAKARIAESKAGLTRAEALYDRWQSEASRVGRLVTGGVIDTQTRDETVNQFKAAEANRAEAAAKVASSDAAVVKAEADRDKAIADITAAEAKLDVARADARRVDALRGYTRLKAPFDGVVTRRGINTGDFVTADGKLGLFTVARVDPMRVVVRVPEADAGLVTVGQEIGVAVQAASGPAFSGKVIRTSWSLEPGSRTLRTEVDLPNPDGRVRPGMYVYARLTTVLPEAWSVPVSAVGKVNEDAVVYLVENGKAIRVVVQLLRGDGQFTQLRQYKRTGESNWTDFGGSESVATPATAVSDGQGVGSQL